MTIKIDHIALAVNSLEDALKFYYDIFGIKAEEVKIDTVIERKFKTAVIPAGGVMIQIMQPTDSEGWIAKHIEEHGEGLHHLALEVGDIHSILDTLKNRGVVLIDTEPRSGHGGSKIAFLYPESQNALIELVEY